MSLFGAYLTTKKADIGSKRLIELDMFHELTADNKIFMVVNHDLGESITHFDDLILLNKELIAADRRQTVLTDFNVETGQLWSRIVCFHGADERTAVDYFFTLLDEFRQEKDSTRQEIVPFPVER